MSPPPNITAETDSLMSLSSWSLREAAKNHTLLTAQSNAISSQIMQLHDLENAVLAGNSMILDRLTVPTSAGTPPDTLASTSQRLQVKVRQTKKSPSHRKFRIALPRSFVDCVGVRRAWNRQRMGVPAAPGQYPCSRCFRLQGRQIWACAGCPCATRLWSLVDARSCSCFRFRSL
jgi:hypothetical protein